jgi:uncharacterized membrane protein YqhA
MPKPQSKIERLFEQFLWNYRFIVLIAVLTLLVSTTISFYFGVINTIGAFHFITSTTTDANYILLYLISALDDFLLGLVLLIISFGIYELFISDIDPIETQQHVPQWLKFHSLDELKSSLSKLIIIILIVYFFKTAIVMKFETPQSLLYLAGGILLVAIANYLSHKHTTPLFGKKQE